MDVWACKNTKSHVPHQWSVSNKLGNGVTYWCKGIH